MELLGRASFLVFLFRREGGLGLLSLVPLILVFSLFVPFSQHKRTKQKTHRYARVAARIEIEVELESEVPAAEAAASRRSCRGSAPLREAESAAAAGAAAADEVERLLRSP